MKKPTGLYAASLLVVFIALFTFAGQALAQDISLAWDPSESQNVAGYKIYYKAGDTQLPYDGIEALQGPSPIVVGKVTSVTLTQFPEGQVYYFWATAYDNEGNESDYSNMVASEWIPAPISPEQGDSTTTPATLIWTAAPSSKNMTYTISYGTSKKLKSEETDSAPPRGRGSSRGRKKSPSEDTSQDDDSVVVAGLTDNYYVTEELETGITYYWQVTAVDKDGQQHESVISSFIAL